jgi:predicted PurR-regulated permease PerM
LPVWLQGLEARLESGAPGWLAPVKTALLETIRDKLANAGQMLLPLLQQATAGVASVVGGAIMLVLIAVLSFFLLKDGAELKARTLGTLAPARRALWEDVLADVHVLLGQFIRAWVLLSVITFAAYAAAFSLMGVPYALLLATAAGVLEFIPVVGPLLAATAIVLVVLISGSGPLWLVLAFLGAYRLFLDYVLMPHLMSQGLALHPVLVIAGALAGEAIAGIPGTVSRHPGHGHSPRAVHATTESRLTARSRPHVGAVRLRRRGRPCALRSGPRAGAVRLPPIPVQPALKAVG